MRKTITIFTPTYNRAYILPQLYESLKKQTNKGFKWLIVDDGSVDETQKLVKNWIDEKLIQIRYIRQGNGGKMKAHNTGVQNTDTELFFCVDSDDYLVDTAVETILNEWNSLSEDEKQALAGMVGYKGSSEDKPIGNGFPKKIAMDTLSGLYQKGFSGDTALIFRTAVIVEFPFPIIGEEKFITEAYVYDQIDQSYQLYTIRKVITVSEYRPDGLTQNLLQVTFHNPCGYVAYYLQKGNFEITTKNCFLDYIRASAFSKYTKKVKMPVYPSRKVIYAMSCPFGCLFFLYKRRIYVKRQKEGKK